MSAYSPPVLIGKRMFNPRLFSWRTRLAYDRPFEKELGSHRLSYEPGGSTLVVSFDNAARPRDLPYEGREAWGRDFYVKEGHSLLGVIAATPDWYRSAKLIAALEELSREGFFDSFSRVVLTGGSMGGFASGAFARLVPGCTIIAFSPQSTLKRELTPWEDRFPHGRAKDWTLPFGDAAQGAQAASLCYVVYDDLDPKDRAHADRFGAGSKVVHLRVPAGGHGVSPTLAQIGKLKTFTRAMIAGELNERDFSRGIRNRRVSLQYRRTLAKHAISRGHYSAAQRVCDLSLPLFPKSDLGAIRQLATEAADRGASASEGSGPTTSDGAQAFLSAAPHRFDRRFPNLRGTIFIVTYGRTGSTLLQNILMTIPGCTIRGENHNVMETLWNSAMRCRMTRRTWGAVEQASDHPWYGADKMHPAGFGRAITDAFVDHVLVPPRDARWFGFKEIRYNAFGDRFPEVLDFMNFHFKNAMFVFNTRRLEDVSKSAWWKNWRPEDVKSLVEGMDQRFADYHATNPRNSFLTSYEEFSKDPSSLRPLFEKIGEPFDADKVNKVLSRRLKH